MSDSATPRTRQSILQGRILQWVASPFSRGSSQPKDWIQVSRIAGRFFTSWATAGGFFTNWAIREAPCIGRRVLYRLNHMVLVVKNLLANAGCKRCKFCPWVGKIPWSRKWHHTSVVLPVKFYRQRRLAGYSPWMTQHTFSCLQITFHLHPFNYSAQIFHVTFMTLFSLHITSLKKIWKAETFHDLFTEILRWSSGIIPRLSSSIIHVLSN